MLASSVALMTLTGQIVFAADSSDSSADTFKARNAEAETAQPQGRGPITDILVVLDATASMEFRTGSFQGATRLDLARVVTANVLDVAPAGVNLGVLTLRDDVSELRPLEPFVAADRTQIRGGVDTLVPFGDGDLVECFERIGSRLNPTSSPLVVMVTDGQDYNSAAANLAAGKLHDAFGDRLRFVLVGICKQGEIADRLRALASSAGGDSISLINENGIPTGLASVREACDEVRRHRQLLLERLENDHRLMFSELAKVRDEIKRSRHTNGQLTAELQSSRDTEHMLNAAIIGKENQIAEQSGRITELKQQAETLRKNLSTTKIELGEQGCLRDEADQLLKKCHKDLRDLEKTSKRDKEALAKLKDAQVISDEEKQELNVYRESWIAPFAHWSATLGGLLGALFLVGGPGASMITTRLLGGKLGMAIGAGQDEVTTTVTETISQRLAEQRKEALADLKATELAIEKRVTELASQQFERTVQKIEETRSLQEDAGRKLEEIGNSANDQFSRVTEVVSLAIGNVGDELKRAEEKLLAGQTQILGGVDAAQSDREKNADILRTAIDNRFNNQAALIRDNSAVINGQFHDVVRVSAERFEATRLSIETGRREVGQVREALRNEINDAAEETIRRVGEASESQFGSIIEVVRETRDGVREQDKQTKVLTDGIRESVVQMNHQVDQLPVCLEAAGNQISASVTQEMSQQLDSVQITVQSVRDQIDQVRHQFEAGLRDSELRQIEHSGRTEQLGRELMRLVSSSDDMVQVLKSETATMASELKDVAAGLATPLTRVESLTKAVIREFDLLRRSDAGHPEAIVALRHQLEQLQQPMESLRSVADLPTTQSVDDSTAILKSSSLSGHKSGQQAAAETSENLKSTVNWQEVLELSKLPGLGRKSAETLVREGVNSIHELADLADDRQGRISAKGGQFKRIDEWVAVARKVRMLREEHEVPLNAAIVYAKTDAWPERLRHLSPEEHSRLSREFRGFAAWLHGSDELATDDGNAAS